MEVGATNFYLDPGAADAVGCCKCCCLIHSNGAGGGAGAATAAPTTTTSPPPLPPTLVVEEAMVVTAASTDAALEGHCNNSPLLDDSNNDSLQDYRERECPAPRPPQTLPCNPDQNRVGDTHLHPCDAMLSAGAAEYTGHTQQEQQDFGASCSTPNRSVASWQGDSGCVASTSCLDRAETRQYDWFVADLPRDDIVSHLMQDNRRGAFLISELPDGDNAYTLSMLDKDPGSLVKHYAIDVNSSGWLHLREGRVDFKNLGYLVNYHTAHLDILPALLRHPRTIDEWEIDTSKLKFAQSLGRGLFKAIRRGVFRRQESVLVKICHQDADPSDFFREVNTLMKLRHVNLIKLIGVCSSRRMIITEYMAHGTLLDYLRRQDNRLSLQDQQLLNICRQVCSGMTYLERRNVVHRNLAARNCFVTQHGSIKLADVGRLRHVFDFNYELTAKTVSPFQWASPEVLDCWHFSTKSDVWAFGILMWEVFTKGKVPFQDKNYEEFAKLLLADVLEKPTTCHVKIYSVMKICWQRNPEDRPTFRELEGILERLSENAHALK